MFADMKWRAYFLFRSQLHDIGANAVHEILRVGGDLPGKVLDGRHVSQGVETHDKDVVIR